MFSTWPNIMVEVVGKPTAWAALIILIHSIEFNLSGQITARISSCRISAAVPGNEFNPDFFSSNKNSSVEILRVLRP